MERAMLSLSLHQLCTRVLGKFYLPEEFPVERLYDIYMQKHALDDLAFAIEFKVGSMDRMKSDNGSLPLL